MTVFFSKIFKVQLVGMLSIFLLSCTNSPMNSPAKPDERINRDAAPFREKIVGHWVAEKGKTDFYIGKDVILMIDGGRTQKLKYFISETNEAERTMAIQVVTLSNGGHKKLLKFAPNFKSLTEIVSVGFQGKAIELSEKWIFIDSQTIPAGNRELEFRDGIEEGCSQRMRDKKNSESDIKIFCSCFADTLVDGMTKKERDRLVAGDKNLEFSLVMRNGGNLSLCEKNLSKDAKF